MKCWEIWEIVSLNFLFNIEIVIEVILIEHFVIVMDYVYNFH